MQRQHITLHINTYNRPGKLRRLLNQVFSENHDFDVHVIDDGSSNDYSFIKKYPVKYVKLQNHGKEKYWKLIDKHFKIIKKSKAKYVFFLPDDADLCEGFFTKAIKKWESIEDDKKGCLSLRLLRRQLGKTNWGSKEPELRFFGNQSFYLTGWCDLMFISEKDFIEDLEYKVNRIPLSRWKNNPILGSGVGQQITKRSSLNMYNVCSSMDLLEDSTDSKMNVRARGVAPAVPSVGDKIIAGMATIPSRENTLKRVVNSIIDQVHELHVYLNGHSEIPVCLYHERIFVYQGVDLGDVGKFFKAKHHKGYFMSIDDDIIYPKGYVNYMVSSVEKYDRKNVVTLHGCVFEGEVKSYYKSRKSYHCRFEVKEDTKVHVGGTGVMCYHSDTLNVDYKKFETRNMSDIYIAIMCKQRDIPITVLKHRQGYIQTIENEKDIYRIFKGRDHFQTKLINSQSWQ